MAMLTDVRRRLTPRGQRALDQERARRVDMVMQLVERLVYDLGLLISGADVDLAAYVERTAAERVHRAVAPALTGMGAIQPDFGDFAQVTVEGDILGDTDPVRATVEFNDRSVRVNSSGAVILRLRRQIRLLLLLDPTLVVVRDLRVEVL